jgi:hypothetical protein
MTPWVGTAFGTATRRPISVSHFGSRALAFDSYESVDRLHRTHGSTKSPGVPAQIIDDTLDFTARTL